MNALVQMNAAGGDRLAAALAYAERGWHVFPCAPEAKHPITERGYKDATKDPDKIRAWWTATPNANIGLNLEESGLVAIDADTYKPECEWDAFLQDHALPDTLVQRSARGGTHFIFETHPEDRFKSSLGPGIDVKHKGYILLWPSVFEGAQYEWRYGHLDPVAPAPEWLKRPEKTLAETVGNTSGTTGRTLAEVEEALQYISADCSYSDWMPILQGIHNEFGDDGILLADEWSRTALQRYQEGLVETKFASFTAGGGVTIGTVFDRARKAGADLGALRAKHFPIGQFFEPVDPANLPVVPANRSGAPGETLFHQLAEADETGNAEDVFQLMRIDDLMRRKPPLFLVDRHIPQRALGFVYGKPGAKKSFMVQDMALAIAHGFQDWHGDTIRPTGDGSVIYIAAEGSFDLPLRIEAWCQTRGVIKASNKFFVLEAAVDFMKPAEIEKLIRTARAYSATPALDVVDTVSRAMPGADENLQKEMSLFVRACERIQHAFGCSVLGVHHAGKTGDMRGSTVLRGAGDFVIRIDWENSQGKLTMEKQKAAEDGWSYAFQVEKHIVFSPDPGDEQPVLSSLVFERVAGPSGQQRQECQAPSPTEGRVLDAIHGLIGAPNDGPKAVDVEQVARAVSKGSKKMAAAAARKHVEKLTTKGWLIKADRGRWSLVEPALSEPLNSRLEGQSAGVVCHLKWNSSRRDGGSLTGQPNEAMGKASGEGIFG